VRFRAKILTSGRTATGIEVPAKVVEALGSRRPKVRATINGYTYRSSAASMGGTYMLGNGGHHSSDLQRRIPTS
jgi:hypothetical protein